MDTQSKIIGRTFTSADGKKYIVRESRKHYNAAKKLATKYGWKITKNSMCVELSGLWLLVTESKTPYGEEI